MITNIISDCKQFLIFSNASDDFRFFRIISTFFIDISELILAN